MFWQALLGLWMALVLTAVFLYLPPAMGLGDLSRIIFFHVPLAWVGVLAYLVCMVHGVRYLRNPRPEFDRQAAFNAELGLVFTLLATVTGAVFARYTWGMYWNWDPRQTSIFILLLIYGAYIVLRAAVDEEERRARLASVYSILAFVAVPFLVFIIPRMYATLHPTPIINPGGGMQMDARMLAVFLAALAGFTGLYWWIQSLYARLLKLRRELGKGGERLV